MRISEPATVEQERALPRTFSARSIGYACLMLIALVSRDVVAQTTIDVTLQPGEFSKTIQAPGTATFTVRYRNPIYLCNWPTTNQMKIAIESAMSQGSLAQRLSEMERRNGASGEAIADTLNALSGYQGAFNGKDQEFTQQQLAAGPFTYTFMNRCISVEEARTGIGEILQVIRSYLGLPGTPQIQQLQRMEQKQQPEQMQQKQQKQKIQGK